jgi:hypothetical protein
LTNEHTTELLSTGVHVVLDAAELAPLVARLDVNPGPLCPVDATSDGRDESEMPAPLRAALATIATGRDAARLRIVGESAGVDLAVWFGHGGETTSLRLANDGVHVEAPAPISGAVDVLVDLVGESPFVAVDLEVELEPVAAVVFAALFDEARRETLRALADGPSGERRAVSGADLAGLLARDATDGLLGMVRALVGGGPNQSGPVDGLAIAGALERLGSLGIAERLDGGFVVIGTGLELATRCLALQAEIEATRAWVDATGAVERASSHVLQFGPRDLLAVERVGDVVRIATESALGIVECARTFLTTPIAVETRTAPA